MTVYVLETTDDYRAQAERLRIYGESTHSSMVTNAADSVLALTDRVDYLENVLERLDEWISDFAYYADGRKI